MLIITTPSLLRYYIRQSSRTKKHIALIPTMGNLHDGHMKLIDTAKMYADIIIVSIFINAIQFDHINDLIHYPRTLQEDYKKLDMRNVDLVFVPTEKDMYPEGTEKVTYVDVPSILMTLEGINHSKHFRGVSTIVSKLFNLILPNFVCFGKKDYHQLMMVKKMIFDMNYDINVIEVPIIREKDGLALSSRNIHLTSEERKISPYINKTINIMAEQLRNASLTKEDIISLAEQKLQRKGFFSNSIQILDADTLFELTGNSRRAVILISSFLGKTRLIDNTIVELPIL